MEVSFVVKYDHFNIKTNKPIDVLLLPWTHPIFSTILVQSKSSMLRAESLFSHSAAQSNLSEMKGPGLTACGNVAFTLHNLHR